MGSFVKIGSSLVLSTTLAMVGTGCAGSAADDERAADETVTSASAAEEACVPGMVNPASCTYLGAEQQQVEQPSQGSSGYAPVTTQTPVYGAGMYGAGTGIGGVGLGGYGLGGYGLGGYGLGGYGLGGAGLGGFAGWGGGLGFGGGCGGLGGWGGGLGFAGGCGGLGGWGGFGGGCGGF